jgi:hypothetical protein
MDEIYEVETCNIHPSIHASLRWLQGPEISTCGIILNPLKIDIVSVHHHASLIVLLVHTWSIIPK